jgi:adenylate cyclase
MTPRSDIATRLRLASGLVLMTYACTHLINHTLGIVSLGAMEAGGRIFTTVWRAAPATLLLYAAFTIHVVLAVHKLWRRRSLKMPAWEMAQVVLGLLIPFWLVVHIIGTRGSYQLYGVDDSYSYVLNTLWPDSALRQSFMLILVWLHGCIGIHFWLRLRPWYRALQPWLFALALLLPTLALIGFADAGRELRARAAGDPGWLERLAAAQNWLEPSEMGWIYATERQVLLAFTTILLATLGARAARGLWARYRQRVRLHYPDGVTVSIEPGMSVLEASRAAGVPHASVCGGRGRCSTCRVRLGRGAEHVAPPAPDEARVLTRIGAPDGVRLACQLRPTKDLAVVPLLPAGAGPGCPAPGQSGARHRARDRGAVRRPAGLHPHVRRPPAVRRRVPAQSVLQGHGRGGRGPGRPGRQVPGRRRHGTVRRRPAARDGVPAGSGRGQGDSARARGAQ